jgi:acetyl esterase/lipase
LRLHGSVGDSRELRCGNEVTHAHSPEKWGIPARARALLLLTPALLSMARCAPAEVLNATVPTTGLTVTRGVAFGPRPDQRMDIYQPKDATGLPIVVFFYGGSWRMGSRGMYLFAAASLARTGAVVAVPDYRLYPSVTFPDFLADCAEAVAWVAARQDQLGGGGGLFLMGHSAGAYNAVMLGLNPVYLRAAGSSPDVLAGVIGLAGPYDFLPITDKKVVPVFPEPGPAMQPITYARADAPKLLLLTGTDDHEVRPRNSAKLAARMREVGGRVETEKFAGLGHTGLITAFAPLFRWRAPVLRTVADFIHGKESRQPAAEENPGLVAAAPPS